MDEPLSVSPSHLLNARFETVPYTGRDADLDALHGWVGGGERLSVMLLHAPGGQGKTRLAIEFAREAVASGWRAWQAIGVTDLR